MVLKPEIATCPARLGDLPCIFDAGHAYGHYYQGSSVPQLDDTEAGDQ